MGKATNKNSDLASGKTATTLPTWAENVEHASDNSVSWVHAEGIDNIDAGFRSPKTGDDSANGSDASSSSVCDQDDALRSFAIKDSSPMPAFALPFSSPKATVSCDENNTLFNNLRGQNDVSSKDYSDVISPPELSSAIDCLDMETTSSVSGRATGLTKRSSMNDYGSSVAGGEASFSADFRDEDETTNSHRKREDDEDAAWCNVDYDYHGFKYSELPIQSQKELHINNLLDPPEEAIHQESGSPVSLLAGTKSSRNPEQSKSRAKEQFLDRQKSRSDPTYITNIQLLEREHKELLEEIGEQQDDEESEDFLEDFSYSCSPADVHSKPSHVVSREIHNYSNSESRLTTNVEQIDNATQQPSYPQSKFIPIMKSKSMLPPHHDNNDSRRLIEIDDPSTIFDVNGDKTPLEYFYSSETGENTIQDSNITVFCKNDKTSQQPSFPQHQQPTGNDDVDTKEVKVVECNLLDDVLPHSISGSKLATTPPNSSQAESVATFSSTKAGKWETSMTRSPSKSAPMISPMTPKNNVDESNDSVTSSSLKPSTYTITTAHAPSRMPSTPRRRRHRHLQPMGVISELPWDTTNLNSAPHESETRHKKTCNNDHENDFDDNREINTGDSVDHKLKNNKTNKEHDDQHNNDDDEDCNARTGRSNLSLDATTTASTSSSSSFSSFSPNNPTWRRRSRTSIESTGSISGGSIDSLQVEGRGRGRVEATGSLGSIGGNSSSTGSGPGGSLDRGISSNWRGGVSSRRGIARRRPGRGSLSPTNEDYRESDSNDGNNDHHGEQTRRGRFRRSGSGAGSTGSNGNSLAASLDAGMAALRRWIRSRRFGSSTDAAAGGESSSGQSLSSSSFTTLRLGEEDIFALSHAGEDPRRVVTNASTASDPSSTFDADSNSGYLYYRPYEVHIRHNADIDADEGGIYGSDDESGVRSILLHPLIPPSTTSNYLDQRENQQSRQRSFSEPDRARLVDFFSSVYGSRAIDGSAVSARDRMNTTSVRGGSVRRSGSGGSGGMFGFARGRQRNAASVTTTFGQQQMQRRQPVQPPGVSSTPQAQRRTVFGRRPLVSRSAAAAFESTDAARDVASVENRLSSEGVVGTRMGVTFSPIIPEEDGDNGDVVEEMNEPRRAQASNENGVESTNARLLESEPRINEGGRPRLLPLEIHDRATLSTSSLSSVTPMIASTAANVASPADVTSNRTDAVNTNSSTSAPEPNRRARGRWIRINRRFQFIITMVALIFSLLLFAILVCWVFLTSTYVISIDKYHNTKYCFPLALTTYCFFFTLFGVKQCDVPLKTYFWLATLQLILDIFRADIMKWLCRWRPDVRQRIPPRVILYNVAYLIYAMLVLRMGVRSVFLSKNVTCPKTAPELFVASTVFVSLSLAAWATIVLGYLVPFCFVAILLTRNGYFPNAEVATAPAGGGGARMGMGVPGGMTGIGGIVGGVFPNTYSNPAPPECVDRLRIVLMEEFPASYPKECCICMMEFVAGEVIVVTPCEHVFHKRCCQEWLQHSRTCPYCRTDVPEALGMHEGSTLGEYGEADQSTSGSDGIHGRSDDRSSNHRFGSEEFRREVSYLLRFLRREERRQPPINTSSAEPRDAVVELPGSGSSRDENGSQSPDRGSSHEGRPSQIEQEMPHFEV